MSGIFNTMISTLISKQPAAIFPRSMPKELNLQINVFPVQLYVRFLDRIILRVISYIKKTVASL